MSSTSNKLGDSKDSSDQWLMKADCLTNEFSRPHSNKEITGGPCGDCATEAINCTVPILLQPKKNQRKDYQMNNSDAEFDNESVSCSKKNNSSSDDEAVSGTIQMMRLMRMDEKQSSEKIMEALVSKSGILAPAIVYRNSATSVDNPLRTRDASKSLDYCPPKKKIRTWTPPGPTASTSSGYVSSEGKLAQKSLEELGQHRSHIFPNVIFENENENQSKTSSASSRSRYYNDYSSKSSDRGLKILDEDEPSKSDLMEVKVLSPSKSPHKQTKPYDSSVSSFDEDEVFASNIKFEHLYMTTINSTSSASESDCMRVKKKRRKRRNVITSANSLSKWDEIKEFNSVQQEVSEAELNDPYFEGFQDNPQEFYLKNCTNCEVPKIFDKELSLPALKVTAQSRRIDDVSIEDDIPYQLDENEEEQISEDPYFMFRRIGRRCLEMDNSQTMKSRLDDSSIESIIRKARRRKMRAEDLFRAASYEELTYSPRYDFDSDDAKTDTECQVKVDDSDSDDDEQLHDSEEADDEGIKIVNCFRFLISIGRWLSQLLNWCLCFKPNTAD